MGLSQHRLVGRAQAAQVFVIGDRTGIILRDARRAWRQDPDIALDRLFGFATLPPLGEQDDLNVGRSPDCELILDEPSVSKRHAMLHWDDRNRRSTLRDLGSTNGTYLNRRKVTGPMRLERGDKLQIGNTVLELGS